MKQRATGNRQRVGAALRSAIRDPRSADRIFPIDPGAPDAGIIHRAASVLRQGGLVAFPTETVYGLGARASDPEAIERLIRAKGRPPDKPFSLLVPGLDVALGLCAESRQATLERLGRRFWPGPLTLVVPAEPSLVIGHWSLVIARYGGLGLRVPDHPVALALLRALGEPLAAPSANPSGSPEPRTAQDVLEALGEEIDLILDGGETALGEPSTVVDLTGPRPKILREGLVSLGQIKRALEPGPAL